MVLIPNNNIALGKLAQALVSGATVLAIEGNFDDGLRIVKDLTANFPIAMLNSLNPYRLEGQKTGAFEVCDFLGSRPICIPFPLAMRAISLPIGKVTASISSRTESRLCPKCVGFQAAGAAPLVLGHGVDAPETIATAIRIGHPARAEEAIQARDESGGLIDSVTDDEILAAQKQTAALSGIFGEPACAAPLAGIKKLNAQGFFAAERERLGRKPVVVSVVTGHGLKDPNTAIRIGGEPIVCPRQQRRGFARDWVLGIRQSNKKAPRNRFRGAFCILPLLKIIDKSPILHREGIIYALI